MSAGSITIAIDPGKAGGFAWVDGRGRAVACPMPDTPGEVLGCLKSMGIEGLPVEIIMEAVSGYAGGPGQPGSAMFKFGEGFGFLQGCCMALGYPVEMVRPQTWQKALGLGHRAKDQSKADWKRKLRAAAERLFPSVRVTLATADALLILRYAMRRKEAGSWT